MVTKRKSKLGLQMAGFAALVAVMVVLAGQVMADAQGQRELRMTTTTHGDLDPSSNMLCYRECSFSR